MKPLWILTTKTDISLPFFSTPTITHSWDITTLFYEDCIEAMTYPEFHKALVFLRDPFTASIAPDVLRPYLEKLLMVNKEASYIDSLRSVDDLYMEDKWQQYQIYKDYMPLTTLLSEGSLLKDKQYIFKKRISSRSKGITFQEPQEFREDYIAQERIAIVEEYRVLEVRQEILSSMLVKRSKTEHTTTKAEEARPISDDVLSFVLHIQKHHHFDLVGYDIAKTETGLYLLEVNRSPQIKAYVRHTHINPFELLLSSYTKLS